ncbi:hypothetical protein [Lentimicrobium sp. S6]|uniref:hypothetical protein n=1 Tax=Lentimicrobium sp. S6 TaxID=2735872 RepID=UPI0015560560|nr:hypothetical protein [Lentimicrobium sp. S6]NPD48073.1 hypothetical protein [Lentimicrobium sp. S6]
MSDLIVIEKEDLAQLMRQVVKEELKQYLPKPDPNGRTYNRTQVGKILKRGSRKVNELIDLGMIKITKDGQITEEALNNYLENKR